MQDSTLAVQLYFKVKNGAQFVDCLQCFTGCLTVLPPGLKLHCSGCISMISHCSQYLPATALLE